VKHTADLTGRLSNVFQNARFIPNSLFAQTSLRPEPMRLRVRFGFEKQTTDWRRVIEDPAVEVVNVAAPNNLHLEIVRHAASQGKHILCEKPVGRNPRETAAIEHVARQAGVMSFVGYNYRWAPLVQYGRKLIRDGVLGNLTHYRGRFFAGYASDPRGVLSWRFQQELAGLGVLGDLMSHVIDMAHFIAGSIQEVVGMRRTYIAERPLATAGQGTHFTNQHWRTDGQGYQRRLRRYPGGVCEWSPRHF
jgi:predicted dehydrogenase